MDAKELMHGDWVLSVYDNKPYRYGRLSRNHTCHYTIDEKLNFNSDLKPIPLTEEILTTNGLRWSGTWRAFCKFTENKKFIMVTNNDEEGFGLHSTKIRFRNVHELQHVLRICGFNDLADNFKIERL